MPATISIYETDFGTVILPDDFPVRAVRKNGLPDRRSKFAENIREYFASVNVAAEKAFLTGRPVRYMRAMSWSSWLEKTG